MTMTTTTRTATSETTTEALTTAARLAGRMHSKDNLGRNNAEWAAAHAHINALLDRLEREHIA